MKLFLTGMLLLVSLSTLADQTSDTKKALGVSISQANLDCQFSVLSNPDSVIDGDKVKEAILVLLNIPSTTVSIANRASSSIITTSTKWIEDKVIFESVVNFNLSSDLKRIGAIKIETFNNITVDVNIGTVLNPKFITQIRKEYIVKGKCEAEY